MVGGRPATDDALSAVVSVGDGECSGVLVRSDIVLTSAHCVQRPVERVTVAGRDVRVEHCEAHPGYRAFALGHDLGVCRLVTSAPMSPLPLVATRGASLAVGDTVTLAGYGASGPFAHDANVLRAVDTSVGRVREVGDHDGEGYDGLEVGDLAHTACWGDSGGPVLAERDGVLGVIGILHGASKAMCASPAEAVDLRVDRVWLEHAIGGEGTELAAGGEWPVGGLCLTAFVLAATLRGWRRRVRGE